MTAGPKDTTPIDTTPVDAAPASPPTWWRRNKWGLILLVPAIVLALAAASFRLVTLYLPWSADIGRPVTGQVEIGSDRFSVTYPGAQTYTATLTPVSLTQIDSYVPDSSFTGADVYAAPGGALWQLEIEVNADPEMMLLGCSISVEDANGTTYSAIPGKVSAGELYPSYGEDSCVPPLNSGPSASLTGAYIPADDGYERPGRYRLFPAFALPEGIAPAVVRVEVAPGPHWTIPVPN